MNKITTIKNSQNDTPFIAGLWGKIGRQQTKNWLDGSRNNNKGERWERRVTTYRSPLLLFLLPPSQFFVCCLPILPHKPAIKGVSFWELSVRFTL